MGNASNRKVLWVMLGTGEGKKAGGLVIICRVWPCSEEERGRWDSVATSTYGKLHPRGEEGVGGILMSVQLFNVTATLRTRSGNLQVVVLCFFVFFADKRHKGLFHSTVVVVVVVEVGVGVGIVVQTSVLKNGSENVRSVRWGKRVCVCGSYAERSSIMVVACFDRQRTEHLSWRPFRPSLSSHLSFVRALSASGKMGEGCRSPHTGSFVCLCVVLDDVS